MLYLEKFTQSDFIFFLVILTISIISLLVTRRFLKVSFPYFFMGFLGLIIGLVVGSLVGNLFGRLPADYGRWIPLIVNVFVTVAILDLFLAQAPHVQLLYAKIFGRYVESGTASSDKVFIDTSALIDGRIQSMVESGFLPGTLLVPRFIILELQKVADSKNSLKRARGRRGLEVLFDLQKSKEIAMEVLKEDSKENESIDSRLVKLAKQYGGKILTVDYNLNRVAQIQKVEVLNINQLAEALKPVLVPGERLIVKVIQAGKEEGQGVGYLPDGTMIVIEKGAGYIGKSIRCEVVRIFHTVAGKMIFAAPIGKGGL